MTPKPQPVTRTAVSFNRKKLALAIGLMIWSFESSWADPPTFTPGVNANQPTMTGEMLRQQGNPSLPVAPLSPTDVMQSAALSTSPPQPGGLRAGSFLLYPALSLSQVYDSNSILHEPAKCVIG